MITSEFLESRVRSAYLQQYRFDSSVPRSLRTTHQTPTSLLKQPEHLRPRQWNKRVAPGTSSAEQARRLVFTLRCLNRCSSTVLTASDVIERLTSLCWGPGPW